MNNWCICWFFMHPLKRRIKPHLPCGNQLHPFPTTHSNFLKIHLNIILPPPPGSPQWSLSLRFPHQHPVQPSYLPHTRHMPTHLILLDLRTCSILGEEYRSFSSTLCNFLHSHLRLKYSPQHHILKHRQPMKMSQLIFLFTL